MIYIMLVAPLWPEYIANKLAYIFLSMNIIFFVFGLLDLTFKKNNPLLHILATFVIGPIIGYLACGVEITGNAGNGFRLEGTVSKDTLIILNSVAIVLLVLNVIYLIYKCKTPEEEVQSVKNGIWEPSLLLKVVFIAGLVGIVILLGLISR